MEKELDELFAPLDAGQRSQLQDLLDALTGTGPATG